MCFVFGSTLDDIFGRCKFNLASSDAVFGFLFPRVYKLEVGQLLPILLNWPVMEIALKSLK